MIYQDANTGNWFEPRLDEQDAIKMVQVKRPLTIEYTKGGPIQYYDEDEEVWKPIQVAALHKPTVVRDIAYMLNPLKLNRTYVD